MELLSIQIDAAINPGVCHYDVYQLRSVLTAIRIMLLGASCQCDMTQRTNPCYVSQGLVLAIHCTVV
jgi:hypothetical protein